MMNQYYVSLVLLLSIIVTDGTHEHRSLSFLCGQFRVHLSTTGECYTKHAYGRDGEERLLYCQPAFL